MKIRVAGMYCTQRQDWNVKLMQHLTVAGYKTYCPMQTIYVNWNGKTKEIIVPFFSGCVFVEGVLRI